MLLDLFQEIGRIELRRFVRDPCHAPDNECIRPFRRPSLAFAGGSCRTSTPSCAAPQHTAPEIPSVVEAGQPRCGSRARAPSRQDRKRLAKYGLDGRGRAGPALLEDPEGTAHLSVFETQAAERPPRGLAVVPALARVDLLLADLLLDVPSTEVFFRRERVVRPAPDPKIRRIVGAAERPWGPMVELEQCP
jgi:hypothetical protein